MRAPEGNILSSLDKVGDLFVAARGGAGGKGNHFFLSNENRAPLIAEIGATGVSRLLHVELKTMAHAGLVCTYIDDATLTFANEKITLQRYKWSVVFVWNRWW